MLTVNKKSIFGSNPDDERNKSTISNLKIQLDEQNQTIEELRKEKIRNLKLKSQTLYSTDDENNPKLTLLQAKTSILKSKLMNYEKIMYRDATS